VEGLGHCGACHTTRNYLGGPDSGSFLAGALIPTEDWYAPSLTSKQEAALAQQDVKEIASLLRTGVSSHHAVFGPMADVIYDSLQHLTEPDVNAMAIYLKSLPQQDKDHSPKRTFSKADEKSIMDLGRSIYEDKCVECHSTNGKGFPSAYPPLAGNQSLLAREPVNAIRIVLNGGFPPGTAHNPQPFGMSPYGPSLNDNEIAAVVSYIRGTWGNNGNIVTPSEVNKYRSVPID
jgi:mono/diheme cytochrome c family protein